MDFTSLCEHIRAQRVDVTTDSRTVKRGDVFVVITGVQDDGAKYIADAVRAGAAFIVCTQSSTESSAAEEAGVQIVHYADTREAVWRLAQARYATDTLKLKVIGITGTNGKTTIAYILEHLLTSLGYKVGVLGTVNYRWPGHSELAPLTTPDSLRLHAMLADMEAAGVDVAVLEVSSHALAQQRVGGVNFAGALFTNVTQDHLDFHADMPSYFAAKATLFTQLPLADKIRAVNTDDAWGRQLLTQCPHALSFGLTPAPHGSAENHVQGNILSMSTAGLRLNMSFRGNTWQVSSPLVGAYNASNLLAVQTLALGLGIEVEAMQCLQNFYGVPGRLERIPNAQGLDVFVDYAHTPDALINVLSALRGAGFTRIITVFGCGGNRDRAKRPLMGHAVAQYSDVAVLTSDNPRHENPMNIIDDVLRGFEGTCEIIVEPDRRKATAQALGMMHKGDVLCIAGKGHEEYQSIQGVKYPYSDQQTVRELLTCV